MLQSCVVFCLQSLSICIHSSHLFCLLGLCDLCLCFLWESFFASCAVVHDKIMCLSYQGIVGMDQPPCSDFLWLSTKTMFLPFECSVLWHHNVHISIRWFFKKSWLGCSAKTRQKCSWHQEIPRRCGQRHLFPVILSLLMVKTANIDFTYFLWSACGDNSMGHEVVFALAAVILECFSSQVEFSLL